MSHPEMRSAVGLADPRDNMLLAGLSEAAYGRLEAALEPTDFRAGDHLAQAPAPDANRFYFVGRGVVSLLYTTAAGESAEMAVIGREGGVGLDTVFAAHANPGERVVQVSGCGWSIDAGRLRREFERGGAVQDVLLAFNQALMAQTAQTAVCNRHHSVELQFIRWLLLCLDRLSGNDLPMTQEAIARMLGVRRAGVSEAAGRLRRDGIIELARGRIHVNDRAALEARACECYRVVRDEYARVLLGLGPARHGA